jgi:pantoate--beta-alanine ligase
VNGAPLTTVRELSRFLSAERAAGRTIGFVPTMGALHEGHLELVREARRRSDVVLVSIFVNPTQFGPNEDFARYPRDVEGDLAKCASAGATAAFVPDVSEMYPEGSETRVTVGKLAAPLCGVHRPGHFEGVATVVAKLFAAVGPCVAVFGRKDYQQLKVIERMATDLLFPVTVVGHPTVRDFDGLALSSRNAYLSADERRRALAIPSALAGAASAFAAGERSARALLEPARQRVEAAARSIDYVTLADPRTLAPCDSATTLSGPVLLAIAARIEKTRLIDNMVLGEDVPPKVKEPTESRERPGG